MQWVSVREDTRLPDWLKKNINEVCPTCGSVMENGYNENGECTRRRCSNYSCPSMVGERIGKMCSILSQQGIKGGIGTQMAINNRLTSHFQAVPLIFKDGKPQISLATYFRCGCIYGIDADFDDIVGTANTVSEVMSRYNGKYLSVLKEHEEELLLGEQYFDIIGIEAVEKKYSPVLFGDIVITGQIPGVKNRDNFVGLVNRMYQGLTAFGYSKSKRKTGLYCCIAEDKSTGTGKINAALEGGYPVYTSAEFFNKVNSDIREAGCEESLMQIWRERGRS